MLPLALRQTTLLLRHRPSPALTLLLQRLHLLQLLLVLVLLRLLLRLLLLPPPLLQQATSPQPSR